MTNCNVSIYVELEGFINFENTKITKVREFTTFITAEEFENLDKNLISIITPYYQTIGLLLENKDTHYNIEITLLRFDINSSIVENPLINEVVSNIEFFLGSTDSKKHASHPIVKAHLNDEVIVKFDFLGSPSSEIIEQLIETLNKEKIDYDKLLTRKTRVEAGASGGGYELFLAFGPLVGTILWDIIEMNLANKNNDKIVSALPSRILNNIKYSIEKQEGIYHDQLSLNNFESKDSDDKYYMILETNTKSMYYFIVCNKKSEILKYDKSENLSEIKRIYYNAKYTNES